MPARHRTPDTRVWAVGTPAVLLTLGTPLTTRATGEGIQDKDIQDKPTLDRVVTQGIATKEDTSKETEVDTLAKVSGLFSHKDFLASHQIFGSLILQKSQKTNYKIK